MIINIISVHESKTYNDVIWLEITTEAGNCIILPGHAPFIASLIPDKPLVLLQKNERTELVHLQKRAFLEVTHNIVTVII